jgi:hypothetical protein
MIHDESISPTATDAQMRQVAAWPAARSATAISDKQDVVDPVHPYCVTKQGNMFKYPACSSV